LFNSAAASSSSCMAGSVLRASAATPVGATSNAAFAACTSIGGRCGTGSCAGTLVRNKCGKGAEVCCVPRAADTPSPSPAPVSPSSNCMSTAGLAMVKSFEGFYAKQYKDVAGIPTIGYGTLCSDGLIRCPGPVSEPDAARIMGADLVKKYSGCVRSTVKAALNNNQFSALVSFAYNAGCGAMTNVAKYAGLDRTSGANYAVVPSRMALYNKAKVKGVLTVVRGLVRRRAAEGALFVSTQSANCMPQSLRSSVPGAAAPVVLPGQPKPVERPYDARDLFNLRRGEVDLASGTEITIPERPNGTNQKIVARADIADRIRSHSHVRQNRGPVAKWSKAAQKAARFVKVQNE